MQFRHPPARASSVSHSRDSLCRPGRVLLSCQPRRHSTPSSSSSFSASIPHPTLLQLLLSSTPLLDSRFITFPRAPPFSLSLCLPLSPSLIPLALGGAPPEERHPIPQTRCAHSPARHQALRPEGTRTGRAQPHRASPTTPPLGQRNRHGPPRLHRGAQIRSLGPSGSLEGPTPAPTRWTGTATHSPSFLPRASTRTRRESGPRTSPARHSVHYRPQADRTHGLGLPRWLAPRSPLKTTPWSRWPPWPPRSRTRFPKPWRPRSTLLPTEPRNGALSRLPTTGDPWRQRARTRTPLLRLRHAARTRRGGRSGRSGPVPTTVQGPNPIEARRKPKW